MKKILILMLVFVMAFSFAACDPKEDTTAVFAEFKAAAEASSSYSKITVETKVDTDIAGELKSSIVTEIAEDGSKTITYTRDVLDSSDALAAPKTETKTITCDASGTYSDGGSFVEANKLALGFKLSLATDKLLDYSVSESALSASISKDNVESVLGVNFGADVDIVITLAGGKVSFVSVSYTDANGYAVATTCTYE